MDIDVLHVPYPHNGNTLPDLPLEICHPWQTVLDGCTLSKCGFPRTAPGQLVPKLASCCDTCRIVSSIQSSHSSLRSTSTWLLARWYVDSDSLALGRVSPYSNLSRSFSSQATFSGRALIRWKCNSKSRMSAESPGEVLSSNFSMSCAISSTLSCSSERCLWATPPEHSACPLRCRGSAASISHLSGGRTCQFRSHSNTLYTAHMHPCISVGSCLSCLVLSFTAHI